MAVSYVGHLNARLRARFHVQVELTHVPSDFQTPGAILVEGCVVRIFRGDSSLSIGDKLIFHVHVYRPGDPRGGFLFGPTYMLYEKLFTAGYIEAFLNGTPPRCEIALDECMILSAPTPRPRSVSLRLAKMAATSQLEIYRDLEAVSNVRSMLVASLVLPEAA